MSSRSMSPSAFGCCKDGAGAGAASSKSSRSTAAAAATAVCELSITCDCVVVSRLEHRIKDKIAFSTAGSRARACSTYVNCAKLFNVPVLRTLLEVALVQPAQLAQLLVQLHLPGR